jgi:PTH1 family peptidyl-tRNA hydrolase
LKLIMGLGNPGARYEGTRHNVGFQAIDRIARVFGITLQQRIARSLVGLGSIRSEEAALAKPQTFMNRSGTAAKALLGHFRLEPSGLVVVHDDLDLELGRLRIKKAGGPGGNRGVESIIASLETDRFTRIKIGVGRPEGSAAEYVLNAFRADENEELQGILDRVVEAAALIVEGRTEQAMNRFH